MRVFRPGGLELTQKAVDTANIKAGDKALDIGCGFGDSLKFLRDTFGLDTYGVDSAKAAVDKATELMGRDKVLCADASSLPFEDGSFQLVLMECVLTLIAEPEKALDEAVRVLSPGGTLIISGLSRASGDALCSEGCINISALRKALEERNMHIALLSDETEELKRFVAEIIFEYDSIENYIRAADAALGGNVLGCKVPKKGTGYVLLSARKNNKKEKNDT